jgi:uncharacterized membrane protein YdjX (TVP38/TMEM64 family)
VAGIERVKPYLKLLTLVGILVVGIVVVRLTPLGAYLTLDGLVDGLGVLRSSVWAPVAFVVIYATATAVALPGSILTIAGGAVFGFWGGALLNTIGANIGANLAFVLARSLGREGLASLSDRLIGWFARVFGRDRAERLIEARVAKMSEATAQYGFFGLLVLRLVPLVPFNALNFGSGFTKLRWRDYALATVIGILPGTLVYTFFADALVLNSTEASQDARVRLWIAAGLLLALSAIPLIVKKLGLKLPTQPPAEASQ